MDTFLRKYLDQHTALPAPTPEQQEVLVKIETKLTDQVIGDTTFSDAVANYGDQIVDLVRRVTTEVRNYQWTWTLSGFIGTMHLVGSIATEVWQIIEKLQTSIIPPGLTPEQTLAAKVSFGQDLVFYIWKIVDPLAGHFGWLPFKATIEKKLVYWLAGMGLWQAYNFFKANLGVEILSADAPIKKAL